MKKGKGLKLGVIGAGTMGAHHARIASTLPGAKLAGIADNNLARAQEIAALYAVPFFSDYKELFPQIEAVVVAAPTATHFEIAKECLLAGKPVLVEKPLAGNLSEAQCLASLAQEKAVLCAVGHIERFNPAFQELVRLVRKEKIIGLTLQRTSPLPTRITDANVIQDVMIHDLDLLLALLPQDEIESLKVEGEKVKTERLDRVSALIYYKSGVIARVVADRVFADRTRKIVITTDGALFEADLLNKTLLYRDLKHAAPSVHHVKTFDQLTAELTDFVIAVKKQGAPTVDATAGCRAIKLAEEVEKACG